MGMAYLLGSGFSKGLDGPLLYELLGQPRWARIQHKLNMNERHVSLRDDINRVLGLFHSNKTTGPWGEDAEQSWWVDFYFGGARIRKKSPINTKRGAEEHEQRLRQRLLAGLPLDDNEQAPDAMPSFKEFAEEFMATYVKANNKQSTPRKPSVD